MSRFCLTNWFFLATICFVTFTVPLFISGCMVDFPQVDSRGKITGGHPKLQEILNEIRMRRDENSLQHKNLIYTWYSVSIAPTPQSIVYKGSLPGDGKNLPPANYHIVCSYETIDRAYVAVLSEVFISVKSHIHKAETCLLFWENGKWITQPTLRIVPVKNFEDKKKK